MPQAVNFTMPFESACNPDRDAARIRGLAWARGFGLVTTEAEERRYNSWDLADLTSRWVPRAPPHELDLSIDTIIVATLIEEHFDGALALSPDDVRDACLTLLAVLRPGGHHTRSGILATALADVWERTCHGVSPEWARRAARHWRGYIEAFPEEARRRQSTVAQTRDDYLALRRDSGFTYSMTDLIERANGFETSERARQVPGVQRLLVLTADLVDTMNDVCSVDKEVLRGDVHNLVLVLQAERGISRDEAMTEAHDDMRRWCEEFIQIEKTLPQACVEQQLTRAETDNLLHFVQGLKEGIGGHPDWYRDTQRYDTLIPKGQASYPGDLMRSTAS